LKNIARKAGFNDAIVYTCTKGRNVNTEYKQKWEMVSSHTARRSFATNMYLTGRMKTLNIMSITGHTTKKSFFRYIKVTKEDAVKQLSGDIIFRK
jgi:integrase